MLPATNAARAARRAKRSSLAGVDGSRLIHLHCTIVCAPTGIRGRVPNLVGDEISTPSVSDSVQTGGRRDSLLARLHATQTPRIRLFGGFRCNRRDQRL